MDEIRKLLDEEIVNEIENLSILTPGYENHSEAVESLSKLYKLRVENERSEREAFEHSVTRYIQLGVDAAGIVLPLIFYAYWMRKGFKFEETGTFTSTTFKGLFNRFRPTRK